MRTSYRHNHTREARKKLLFSAVSLAAAIFLLWRFFDPVSGFITQAAAPLWKGGDYTKNIAGTFLLDTASTFSAIRENERLKHALAQKRGEAAILGALRAENKILKEKLGIPAGQLVTDGENINSSETISAAILARPPRTPYDLIVIDAGSSSGIDIGNKVYASPHMLLGTVMSVSKHTAKVSLFSTTGRETQAELVGDEIVRSVQIEGMGGGVFTVALPRDLEVAAGDVFALPGNNSVALGVVEEVHKDANSPFQTLLARNPVNIWELKWVDIEPESSLPEPPEESEPEVSEEE